MSQEQDPVEALARELSADAQVLADPPFAWDELAPHVQAHYRTIAGYVLERYVPRSELVDAGCRAADDQVKWGQEMDVLRSFCNDLSAERAAMQRMRDAADRAALAYREERDGLRQKLAIATGYDRPIAEQPGGTIEESADPALVAWLKGVGPVFAQPPAEEQERDEFGRKPVREQLLYHGLALDSQRGRLERLERITDDWQRIVDASEARRRLSAEKMDRELEDHGRLLAELVPRVEEGSRQFLELVERVAALSDAELAFTRGHECAHCGRITFKPDAPCRTCGQSKWTPMREPKP